MRHAHAPPCRSSRLPLGTLALTDRDSVVAAAASMTTDDGLHIQRLNNCGLGTKVAVGYRPPSTVLQTPVVLLSYLRCAPSLRAV